MQDDPDLLDVIKKVKLDKSKGKKTEKDKPMSSFLERDGKLSEMTWTPGNSKFLIYDMKSGAMEDAAEFGGSQPYTDDLIDKGVILFPTGIIKYENEKVLFEEIRAFIHKYMDVSEFFEALATYYVALTWLYDNFNTLPYLRVIGDYGSGKSRFLQTVGSICYKPMFAGGATTPSPVFRIIEMFRGTLVFDEADFKESEEWAEIIKILNCGFQAGFPVLRTEDDNGKRSPRAYDCYGPKILATRNDFKDKALESRCLTEKLMETGRMDIPLLLDDDFHKEARRLRNCLLFFRFSHYGKHKIDLEQQDVTIERRLNQVTLPLYSIIEDPEIKEGLRTFMREYNRFIISDRGEEMESMVLENIVKIIEIRQQDGTLSDNIYVKDVSNSINSLITNEKDKITTHKIGWIIRKKLRLELKKDMDGRWIKWDVPIFYKLVKKYGILYDYLTSMTLYTGTEGDSHSQGLHDYMTTGGVSPVA